MIPAFLFSDAAAAPVLAWRPFLDPMDVHTGWWLSIVPLAFFLAMAFKAARVGDLSQYWRHVITMSIQLIAGLAALAVALHLLLEFAVPFLERTL